MKKLVVFSVYIIFTMSTSLYTAPPHHHIQFEAEELQSDRWPQLFSDFYDGMKEALYELKKHLSLIPETLYHTFVGNHAHSNDVAHIRTTLDDDICDEEKHFLEKRLVYIKKHLEHQFNITLDAKKIPRIGIIFSGGGFRAMLTTLGFLCGAQETGILDVTAYCAGLSGSTWALAPWIASQKSIHEFTQIITRKLYDGIDHVNDPFELSELFNLLITKLLCRQFISSIDIYGSIIIDTLLRNIVEKPLLVTLTESHRHIIDGKFPLPIYTAIQTNTSPYEWLEFSPFEIGSSYLKSYVPTWAYGRKFKDGVSVDYSPEQTLGYFLGVFGSAFAVNLKDIVRMTAANLSYLGHELPAIVASTLKKALRIIINSFIGQTRFFPSILNNFTYLADNSPILLEKTMVIVDAGIDFNLPFPPLLRTARKLDILIVYDASADIQGAPELRRALRYAQHKGFKFPGIDFENIDKKLVSVFKNAEDSEAPIIIYFPRIKNEHFSPTFDPDHCIENEYCGTFNFIYEPEDATLVSNFAKCAITQQAQIIKQTIQELLITKYGYQFEHKHDTENVVANL